MRRIALLAVAVLPLSTVGAQWEKIQPGAKVRITAPGVLGSRLTGIVGDRTADTISIVRAGRAPVRVPLSAITQGELSLGKSRRAGAVSGMIWGAAFGLGFGVWAAATPDPVPVMCEDPMFRDSCAQDPSYSDFAVVAVSTVSMSALGAAVGALKGKERWQRLAAPANATAAHVWIAPTPRHGVAVGMRAAF